MATSNASCNSPSRCFRISAKRIRIGSDMPRSSSVSISFFRSIERAGSFSGCTSTCPSSLTEKYPLPQLATSNNSLASSDDQRSVGSSTSAPFRPFFSNVFEVLALQLSYRRKRAVARNFSVLRNDARSKKKFPGTRDFSRVSGLPALRAGVSAGEILRRPLPTPFTRNRKQKRSAIPFGRFHPDSPAMKSHNLLPVSHHH